MKEQRQPIIRVRDWSLRYENNRSREMKDTRWFPMPNDLSADSYVELLAHPDGPAHLGVWTGLLMVASRAKPRGSLVRDDGRPHDSESLALVIRQPSSLVEVAIERLLKIGLLESDASKSRKKSSLDPHPGAGIPQGPARKPQDGALEGKGTEHHHQEGNGKERKRTERARDESATGHPGADTGSDFFPREGDDGKTPDEGYASPEDELKAIFLKKAGGPITIAVLDAIRVNLEFNGVSFGEFVAEARKHIGGEWRNPPGFLRDLSKRFRAKTRSAAAPVTATESAVNNYRCDVCGSTIPGHGARLIEGKPAPCSCASPEYIAHQRARGVFAEEAE
jgi:hypothetical protein